MTGWRPNRPPDVLTEFSGEARHKSLTDGVLASKAGSEGIVGVLKASKLAGVFSNAARISALSGLMTRARALLA